MWLGMWTRCPAAGTATAHPVCIGLGALGTVGRLNRMDIEVDRSKVVGLLCQYALKRRYDGRALRVRFVAARLPVVPRAEVHHGLGIEDRNIVVVREPGR